jgi:hypothetical protein
MNQTLNPKAIADRLVGDVGDCLKITQHLHQNGAQTV